MANIIHSASVGWEDHEQKEFLKAIRAPLMVQTPLQVVIENLFTRVQAQAVFMHQIKERVERISAKDLSAEELLDRIKLLESKQQDGAGSKLSPFNQQEVLARLDALEAKVSQSHPGGKDSDTAGVEVELRLSRLEQRLKGVYNIPGKLVALEQLAAGLGVPIPDLDYPTGGGPPPPQLAPEHFGALRLPTPQQDVQQQQQQQQQQPQQPQQQAEPAPAPAPVPAADSEPPTATSTSNRTEEQMWPSAGKVMSRGGSPPHLPPGSGLNSPRGATPLGASRLGGGLGGGLPFAGALGGPIGSGLGGVIPGIGGGIPALGTSMSGAAHAPMPSLGGGGMSMHLSGQKVQQLGQEVAVLRSDNEALREKMEAMMQQVASVKAGLGVNAGESLSRVQALEEKVNSLQVQVAELAAAARRGDGGPRQANGEVSFADFSLLKSQLEAVAAEAKQHGDSVAAFQEADLPGLLGRLAELEEGSKKAGEPRDMDTLFHERINELEAAMGDLKMELRNAIESALEGAAKVEEIQALEEALEGKASADQLRTLQVQAQALGSALATVSDSLAGRQELGDSLRAAAGHASGIAAAVTGVVGSKLRCLTCDHPLTKPPASSGNNKSGSGFLPRLDSMPGREGVPGGPGMLTADLRASKEDRLAGLSGRGVKLGDVEEYANGVGGVMTGSGRLAVGGSPPREASPGRAVERSRAARQPAGGGKGSGPQVGKTPVFL